MTFKELKALVGDRPFFCSDKYNIYYVIIINERGTLFFIKDDECEFTVSPLYDDDVIPMHLEDYFPEEEQINVAKQDCICYTLLNGHFQECNYVRSKNEPSK